MKKHQKCAKFNILSEISNTATQNRVRMEVDGVVVWWLCGVVVVVVVVWGSIDSREVILGDLCDTGAGTGDNLLQDQK